MKTLKVHVAGTMLYMIPAIALVLSYLLLKESINVIQGLGILLTMISIIWLNRRFPA